MAAKRKTTNNDGDTLRAALDVGNGECSGISNETRYPLGFEPVIAPMTEKRGINKTDERPTWSLKVEKQVLVFGINDVFEHGKRELLRRQSGTTRYTGADYFNLIDALLLNLFGNHRGLPDRISPQLAINLPVQEYNKESTVEEVRETLLANGGKRDISDYEGCILQVQLDPKRLTILPESAGALMHWAIDEKTLERRVGVNPSGSTIVCDIGYETTDMTLFEGMKYQRDRAFTVERAGMGNVTRAVSDYLISSGEARQGDESRIDRALRPLADTRPGDQKWITLPQGEFEVSEVYDQAVSDTAQRIADRLHTLYPEGGTRVLLGGGGTYHMKTMLKHKLRFPITIAPDPEHANLWGTYTTLRAQERRQ